jgi:hypothetical protein
MKAILVICFSFLLMSLSCNKESIGGDCAMPPGEHALTGAWKWVRTDGGFGNTIHDSPASTGKTIVLNLQTNGQYFYTTNGTLSSSGSYQLLSKKCIHNNEMKTYIDFSNDTDLMVEKPVTVNELSLSDDAYDGLGMLYKK